MPSSREPMNEDRAQWARHALDRFGKDTGQRFVNEADDMVSDLLCNLMHLCNQEAIDFHRQLSRAQGNYREEIAEEAQTRKPKPRAAAQSSALRGYAAVISEATDITNPKSLAKIEMCMREDVFHSTLDWQSRDELKRGARIAVGILLNAKELP